MSRLTPFSFPLPQRDFLFISTQVGRNVSIIFWAEHVTARSFYLRCQLYTVMETSLIKAWFIDFFYIRQTAVVWQTPNWQAYDNRFCIAMTITMLLDYRCHRYLQRLRPFFKTASVHSADVDATETVFSRQSLQISRESEGKVCIAFRWVIFRYPWLVGLVILRQMLYMTPSFRCEARI